MKALSLGFALLGLAAVVFTAPAPTADAQGLQLPLISVSPTSLDFGNVPVNSIATQSILVTNDSADSPLTVSNVKTKAPFSETVTSFVLQPGQSRRIDISFAPTATVQYNSACTISSDAHNQPLLVVPLTGWGI